MLDVAVQIAGLFVAFLAVVFVHELGHYYAARAIVGIPAENVRLVVTALPPSVALRDGETWRSPVEFDRYLVAYERQDPEHENFERFAAAGDLFQTGIVVPVALAVALAGFPQIGSLLAVVSLLTLAVYVVYDVVLSLSVGGPRGDYSALWETSRPLPVVLLVGNVLVHLGVFHFA